MKKDKVASTDLVLKNLNVEETRTLFVTTANDQNTLLSSRNIKNTKVITADKLNTYDILNSGKLVISEKAVDQIDNHFNSTCIKQLGGK